MAHPCEGFGVGPGQLFGLWRSKERVALQLRDGLTDHRMNELPPALTYFIHDTRMTFSPHAASPHRRSLFPQRVFLRAGKPDRQLTLVRPLAVARINLAWPRDLLLLVVEELL